jgi:phosphoribosylanthranilate isomerase
MVEYPDEIISTAELVGLRAKVLAKHRQHIEEMREQADTEKLDAVQCYAREHEETIKDYDFQPGDMVLI